MYNILVTGSNGQLGSELRLVVEEKDQVNNYFFTDVADLDITNKNDVTNFFVLNNINIVVNCAAYTNVDGAEDDKENADLINHIGPKNIAEVCRDRNGLLIHISTDYVFDGTKNTPYTETDKTKPLGVYGKTKLKGENAILNSGCEYVIIRTSWLYSSFGNNFLKTMQKLTAVKHSIKVVFDQVGTPTYAGDLANVIYTIIQKKDNTRIGNQIYHYSNEGVCSWYDFAVAINEAFGHNCKVEPCHSDEFPSKVKRPSYSVLDKTKIKDVLEAEIPYWKDSVLVCATHLFLDRS
ncbi:MAG: dTDP-4-dehydrorhamnose reductase [Tissierellia bacterium]|jgi:dTDP-4-dehydrorhamnose reductase|nr:dTDP-4-dehydrorhamnose reductase [Tissierellia bacterium]